MNERITELAKQVCIHEWPEYRPDIVKVLSMKQLHEFAELIIGECASIYDKIDNGNLHMGTDNYLEALHKTFRS